MKIAGMIALNRFPFWRLSVDALVGLCDVIVVRFDMKNGDPEILRQIADACKGKMAKCFIAEGWHCPTWREECLRLLDEIQPDIVLCPDEDEVFDENLPDELLRFWASDKMAIMFEYHPLEASDGRVIRNGLVYPETPHVKAFKWQPNLCYFPYHGRGMPSAYSRPELHWNAVTKIRHYCAFTLAMEAVKNWRSLPPLGRGEKAVTLLGFGPSLRDIGQQGIVGEIWSVNNCYETFEPNVMRRVTRIFEMHTFGERSGGWWSEVAKWHKKEKLENRDHVLAKDGRTHVSHLNECGKVGHRIIMQQPHSRIKNSEAFPLDDVVKDTGVNWFTGTPCYMMAMAVHEGFNHIRIFGLDQLDWEHTSQRECFGAWFMYAVGRNVKMSGSPTFLRKYTKLYGYDYGPEWDEYQENLLWSGHPMSVRYKIPSRVADGELFR